MNRILLSLSVSLMVFTSAYGADFKVLAARGEVLVRHGVQEGWNPVTVGDVLKPEDSIELRKSSSATILMNEKETITIPELVVIDLSDLRMLTQDELLLKLAMEDVRAIPPRDENDALSIPRVTTIHGSNKVATADAGQVVGDSGEKQLRGAKVLYEHKYFATCVLRAKVLFRLYPDLSSKFDMRMMVASAFEKIDLYGEALDEYTHLSGGQLSSAQRPIVEQKIEGLKKANEK